MNTQSICTFKKRLQEGQKVFGIFMKTSDPALVEVTGYVGMDFVILDMEHGPVSMETMQNLLRAAQVANVLPVVRVPAITEEAIGKALDIGAAAVEIPQISNAEQAKKAVKYAKFYPKGERGVCRFVRAAKYSAQPRDEYFSSANEVMVIAQLEGREAIDNLDEILEVEGIDILFIGPYDLSQSLEIPGQTTHPDVIEKMGEIVKKAKEKKRVVGTFTDSLKTLEMWEKAGVQYLSYSVDVGIFYEACQELVENFRQVACK